MYAEMIKIDERLRKKLFRLCRYERMLSLVLRHGNPQIGSHINLYGSLFHIFFSTQIKQINMPCEILGKTDGKHSNVITSS